MHDIHESMPSFVPFLIIFFAAPRIWKTIVSGQRHLPYYQIPRKATWLIGTAYLALLAVLLFMTHLTMPLHFEF